MATKIDTNQDDLLSAGAPTLPDGYSYRTIAIEKYSWTGLRCTYAEFHMQILKDSTAGTPATVVVDLETAPIEQLTRRPTAVLPRTAQVRLAREAAEYLEATDPAVARTSAYVFETV